MQSLETAPKVRYTEECDNPGVQPQSPHIMHPCEDEPERALEKSGVVLEGFLGEWGLCVGASHSHRCRPKPQHKSMKLRHSCVLGARRGTRKQDSTR